MGREGIIVEDDRAGGLTATPFEVSFGGRQGSAVYLMLEELVPANPSSALEEMPLRFSNAAPGQLLAAGGLGALNLFGVGYLGILLRNARLFGVSAAALPTVRTLSALYPPLLLYALGFIAVPVIRSALLNRRNAKIDERNRVRRAWASFVESRPSQALRRKLAAARRLRPGVDQIDEQRSLFRSKPREGEPASDAAAAEQAADGRAQLDSFDERLRARLEAPNQEG